MLNRSAVLLVIALALCCGSAVLIAGQNESRPDAAQPQNSNDILCLDEILQRVTAQYPGRVVETELEHKHGRYVYEIDVVSNDGVKKELKYDARTGALISSKVEDNDDDDDK